MGEGDRSAASIPARRGSVGDTSRRRPAEHIVVAAHIDHASAEAAAKDLDAERLSSHERKRRVASPRPNRH